MSSRPILVFKMKQKPWFTASQALLSKLCRIIEIECIPPGFGHPDDCTLLFCVFFRLPRDAFGGRFSR